jgi:hypothetical protein
MSDSTS